MYIVRENIVKDKCTGYWVDENIDGKLIESFFVTLSPRSCSCKYFAESQNIYNHFHINLVEYWIRTGKPFGAVYEKSKQGKVRVLCEGFI